MLTENEDHAWHLTVKNLRLPLQVLLQCLFGVDLELSV